ncbi:Dipeptidase 1 [Nostocoides japonicum T1-X7]|uniref:Dipeptidase 1 n=1 Tax=Nostocoides japonicum T1-X7 TaxID=1194083 RepID=A0A077LT85_9MICO|nr:dipeptidase [Tetrasphaera japonica]CCH76281.1 Dipeptidase 1 [Tetrasphaera japonica T1-X7]
MPDAPTSEAVRDLLTEDPVLDGHNDLPWELREQAGYDLDRMDPSGRLTTTQTDLPRLAEGGVRAQLWSVFVPQTLRGADAVTATLEQIDVVRRMCERYADRMVLATTADEVRAAWQGGRFASLMGAEGGHQIDCSLGVLRTLFALGVRYLTLTHNENVPWADSATDARRLGGLSPFGREVVREMNRLGMMVDCSHVSAETMRDAIAASAAPPFFSHSSAYAVCPHPRNVPDDVLEETGRRDGVCMVTFVPKFVNEAVRAWDEECLADARAAGVDHRDHVAYTAFQEDWGRTHPQPRSSVDDVVAHVEHVREVAGIRSVGLGGDYDGVARQPTGLEDVTGYPRLLEALHDRGWSRADLAALTSGNALRVLRDTEAVARDVAARRGPSTATIDRLDAG